MTTTQFKAILFRNKGGIAEDVKLTLDDLMPGDTVVRVSHSSLNYKDGLALTQGFPVIRTFPMIPGIDLAGVVDSTSHPDLKPGDLVAATAFGGLSEVHYGGYSERARLPGDWLVRIPAPFTAVDAMAIGTAGFTAMLAAMTLEEWGLKPGDGPVLVTGAAGGVGSVAVAILSKLGHHVVASTGRTEEEAYLRDLGAGEILPRSALQGDVVPLGRTHWAGAVDTVGSKILANVLSQLKPGCAVAACGLASGMDLPANMAPFVLRRVALLGINCIFIPRARYLAVWERLARDLDVGKLRAATKTIPFSGLRGAASDILKGHIRGRLVVEIGG